MRLFEDRSASALIAGFVAVLVGFTSSAVIVFQAAQALQETAAEIASWMLCALLLGVGISLPGRACCTWKALVPHSGNCWPPSRRCWYCGGAPRNCAGRVQLQRKIRPSANLIRVAPASFRAPPSVRARPAAHRRFRRAVPTGLALPVAVSGRGRDRRGAR